MLIYVWLKQYQIVSIQLSKYSSTTEFMLKSIKLRGITPEIIDYNPRTHQRKVFLKYLLCKYVLLSVQLDFEKTLAQVIIEYVVVSVSAFITLALKTPPRMVVLAITGFLLLQSNYTQQQFPFHVIYSFIFLLKFYFKTRLAGPGCSWIFHSRN